MDVAHIKAEQLCCGYKENKPYFRTPAASIDIYLEQPILIGVIGKNGTGKTTLLKTLAGIQRPLSGIIKLNNKTLTHYSIKEKSKWISFLPSQISKIPYIRLKEYLLLGTNDVLSDYNKEFENTQSILHKVSLENKADFFLTQLSDGEMQRAAIARILMRNSPIMIFDEPLAHLDPKQQLHILELFKEYVYNHNKIIIFSSHLTDLVLSYAQKIWLVTEMEFIQKIPEQILIDQDLEKNELKLKTDIWKQKIFATRGFVRIIGDGIAYTYTKYALHRFGIEHKCNKTAPYAVIIEEFQNKKYRWILKMDNTIIQEFNDLEKLIIYLINKL